jgi:hypothetical protein
MASWVPPFASGAAPPMTPGGSSSSSNSWLPPLGTGGTYTYAGGGEVPGNSSYVMSPTIDPNLTSNFFNYLNSQVGQGLPGFNQSVMMPSTGQMTQPGTLTAPLNPIMQQLEQFFQTGQGGPMTGVLPMFNSQIAAMQQPIQQNMANIREQFASQGSLGSSEMGTALSNYMQGTNATEQSMLQQDTMQALPLEMQFGGGLQSLDQSAIQNALAQFQMDLPQNNPLLGYEANASTATLPLQKKPGGIGSALLGGLGSILGDIPGIGSMFSSLFGGGSGGGGGSLPLPTSDSISI